MSELSKYDQDYDPAVDVAALEEHPDNPRRGNTEAIDASMSTHGFYGAVVAQRSTGRILAGNHRYRVAVERGAGTVPVLWLDVDDDQARRVLLTDNRTGDLAEYDYGALAGLLDELQGTDLGLDGTGWDAAELLDFADEHTGGAGSGTGQAGVDDVPEPPPAPVTKPGDVWILGTHRLMCGDATKRDEVALLLGDERPELMVTDPPYGVAVGGSGSKTSRASISGDLTQAAIPLSFAAAVDVLDDNARIYLFGGSANVSMYAGLFDHHLRQQVHLIVWVKENFVLRPNNYHARFELVFFGWKGHGGGSDYWYGDRSQTDLWEVARDREGLHPTQKPVEVCEIPIRNSCAPGGLVFEPFAGSGSTLIAADRLGRRCYGMELEPSFVDVVCCRWQEHTGEQPVLEATGEAHDFAGAVAG